MDWETKGAGGSRLCASFYPFSLVCAISQAATQSSRRCDLCGDTSHLLASCPEIEKWRHDSHEARRMISLLRRLHPSLSSSSQQGSPPPADNNRPPPSAFDSRAGAPPRQNLARDVRSLHHDDDTDTESVCSLGAQGALSTDDGSSKDWAGALLQVSSVSGPHFPSLPHLTVARRLSARMLLHP